MNLTSLASHLARTQDQYEKVKSQLNIISTPASTSFTPPTKESEKENSNNISKSPETIKIPTSLLKNGKTDPSKNREVTDEDWFSMMEFEIPSEAQTDSTIIEKSQEDNTPSFPLQNPSTIIQSTTTTTSSTSLTAAIENNHQDNGVMDVLEQDDLVSPVLNENAVVTEEGVFISCCPSPFGLSVIMLRIECTRDYEVIISFLNASPIKSVQIGYLSRKLIQGVMTGSTCEELIQSLLELDSSDIDEVISRTIKGYDILSVPNGSVSDSSSSSLCERWPLFPKASGSEPIVGLFLNIFRYNTFFFLYVHYFSSFFF